MDEHLRGLSLKSLHDRHRLGEEEKIELLVVVLPVDVTGREKLINEISRSKQVSSGDSESLENIVALLKNYRHPLLLPTLAWNV